MKMLWKLPDTKGCLPLLPVTAVPIVELHDPVILRRVSAELFEEKGDALLLAMIAKLFRPFDSKGACRVAGTAFSTDDHPMNAFQVELRRWNPFPQRLNGKSTACRLHPAKMIDPLHLIWAGAGDGGHRTDVVGESADLIGKLRHSIGTLRQPEPEVFLPGFRLDRRHHVALEKIKVALGAQGVAHVADE